MRTRIRPRVGLWIVNVHLCRLMEPSGGGRWGGETGAEEGRGEEGWDGRRRRYLISQITSPVDSVAPTSAFSDVTTPALCAVSGCSIFIASTTMMSSPASTV